MQARITRNGKTIYHDESPMPARTTKVTGVHKVWRDEEGDVHKETLAFVFTCLGCGKAERYLPEQYDTAIGRTKSHRCPKRKGANRRDTRHP